MKDPINQLISLYGGMLINAIAGKWEVVKQAATEAKTLLINTDNRSLTTDGETDTDIDVCIRETIQLIGGGLSLLGKLAEKTMVLSPDRYRFLPDLDDIVDEADYALKEQLQKDRSA